MLILLKFTDSGTVSMYIKCHERDDGRIDISFGFKDTGVGIKSDIKDKIFDAFKQGEAPDGKSKRGVGLGLTICDKFSKALGGEITVTSEHGVGSEFIFSSTFRKLSLEHVNHSMASLSKLGTRALVVEDNAVNSLVLCKYLSNMGFKCTAVENGQEAVDQVKEAGFDIIFMDCQMPVMDGFEATKEIRGLLGHNIPIIAVSAGVLEKDRQRCFDVGMNDFVEKPISRKALMLVLAGISDRFEQDSNLKEQYYSAS